METTSTQTQCLVSKILQRYVKELKLTVLLVLTKSTFSTWRICFYFLGKPLSMCYCFRAPIKTLFFDACQMTVKSCVLHLFPVSQTGRSHVTDILFIIASFFRSVL